MAKKTKSKQLAFAEIGRRGKPKTRRIKRKVARAKPQLTKRERSMPIADVKIGIRHRKEMGDIPSLARSITEVGLLHPVVVKPDGTLIAGQRRVEAFKALARTEIPVTVVDIASIARGELAENFHRKDFTPSEAVAIKRAVEPLEKAAAEERMKAGKGPDDSGGRGKKKNPVGNAHRVKRAPAARDNVAQATGMDARTLAKAEHIVAAAERDPENYGQFVEHMDETGRVGYVYKKVVNAEKREAYQERADKGGKVEDLHALVASGKRFPVIVADPPWNFERFSERGKDVVGGHYDTMSLDQIKALPVEQLAEKDCVLLLWGTWPNLLDVLDVVRSWGFEYRTAAFVWAKQNANGEGWHTGMGYYTRSNTEPCLLARRGNPERVQMDVHQLIVAPVREHSRKPDESYERTEQLMVGPYLELFARAERPGWVTWGNEVPVRALEPEVPVLSDAAE